MQGRKPASTFKSVVRTAFAAGIFGIAAAVAGGGCNMVSGLDSLTQAATIDDGGTLDGDLGNQEVAGEGGVVSGPTTSNCTPDPAFCNTHCGAAKDNCGQPRTCGDCGENSTCDLATNTCQCAVAAGFCAGRCGPSTDNCTHTEDCGGCDGGTTCSAGGACGCDPSPAATFCGAKKCGSATNNCSQTIFCGSGGTSNCATGTDVCMGDGSCCSPNNTAPCAGKCNTTAVNNCGQTISCPGSCAAGQACDVATCCTPNADSVTCAGACNGAQRVNNCGQTVVCESCTGVCTSGSCCIPNNVCLGKFCGTFTNSCGQSVTCGGGGLGCSDICPSGGTCNFSTGACTCRCGVIQQSQGGLHTEIQPCLPE